MDNPKPYNQVTPEPLSSVGSLREEILRVLADYDTKGEQGFWPLLLDAPRLLRAAEVRIRHLEEEIQGLRDGSSQPVREPEATPSWVFLDVLAQRDAALSELHRAQGEAVVKRILMICHQERQERR